MSLVSVPISSLHSLALLLPCWCTDPSFLKGLQVIFCNILTEAEFFQRIFLGKECSLKGEERSMAWLHKAIIGSLNGAQQWGSLNGVLSNGAQAVTPHLPVTTGCYKEISRLPGSSNFFRKKEPAEESKGMLPVLHCFPHRRQVALPCKVWIPRTSVG